MNEVKYFIRNLKKYMVENNIKTERALADELGCSQPTVHNTLTENTPLTMGFITKTVEATGMSIVQLFSPDPKQYGSAVQGDVQDGNAVAMMELMKKQMEDMEEASQVRIEVEGNLRKHIAELQKENKQREEVEESLRKRIKELQKENELHMANIGDIHHNYIQLREENEALEQENLRLVQEGYHAKNEPVKFDKWNLFVDSTDCTGIIDIGGDQIEVYEVAGIDPYDKKVLVKLYFDEITIK